MAKESGAQAAPRTLAEVLRSWPADRLGRLLRERPDLATPAPHDSAQLASRAATRASVSRALDQLTHGELLVLDALVIAGQTTPEGLSALVRVSDVRSTAVSDALAHLENLALCWRAPEGLRPLTTIAELLVGTDGTSGLRPIGPDPRPSDAIAADLEAVSTEARALLAHVVAAGGTGRTQAARTIGDPAEARTPVEELLARGLLVPAGSGTVVVPGEVGLALHGGRTTDEPVDVTPELATGSRDPKLVARAAAGAAFELTRRVELLLDRWGTHPPAALRTGGLGVRDLKAASTLLGVEAGEAALIIEVCFAAGLLATGTTADEVDAWLPTEAFDAWSTLGSAPRWVRLAGAWLASPRTPALVGTRDSGGKAINALAPELSSGLQAQTRRAALEEIAALPEGDVLATGTGVPSLVARIRWLRPRRPTSRDAQVAASVTEAGMLGFAGLGAVPAYARALLHGDAEEAVRLLDPLLPQPVDHLLVQADLTAVAPGPLTSEISRALHLLADVESRGGATVYRFGKDSLRRAFDAGWSATEVHAYLEGLSRTPLPQPLTYLVDDVARTFGTVRVGHAESFLRADDEGALTELMHHPKAASLRLRRIAPTVIVSDTPLDVLLPRLRELGAAPVVEAADGTVGVARADIQRARLPRTPRAVATRETARNEARINAVVSAIRAGDAAREIGAARPREATSPTAALAALREAVEARSTVLIGYVDNHGSTSERMVDPRRVEGGQLTAYDHRSDDVRTFAVHRITVVQPTAP
ncbi:MAG: helicase C-terminal domain-containing protein [Nocardioides sp.]|jgi:hypothetical protein